MKALINLGRPSKHLLSRRVSNAASRVYSVRVQSNKINTKPIYQTNIKSFSTTIIKFKGLSPDSTEPKTPQTETSSNGSSSGSNNLIAAEISDSEYHEISDQYLNSLVLALEEKAEDSSSGLEVEYSAGVLTIGHPKGTYVLNKQPPNKQVWLSSPVSGPKRYDWVTGGAGQHEKADSEYGTGDDGSGGRWVYLRDGSSLSELISTEVGVEIPASAEGDARGGREGPGGGGAKLDGD